MSLVELLTCNFCKAIFFLNVIFDINAVNHQSFLSNEKQGSILCYSVNTTIISKLGAISICLEGYSITKS